MPIVRVGSADLDIRQTGEGPDLVMLHSLLADRSVFDAAGPVLAREYRLTLVALPGYGQSTPAGNRIETIADRVAEIFDALDLSPQAHLFGNGFGGFTAVALAIRHGQRFHKLVIADALAYFPEEAKQPLRLLAGRVEQEGMEGALDIAIRRMFPPAYIAAHPEVVETRKRALKHMDPVAFNQAVNALVNLDFREALRNITNPTLVMVGAQDATTPPPLARRLADGIPGAQFMEIANCGHCPQLEQPQAFITALKTFLGQASE